MPEATQVTLRRRSVDSIYLDMEIVTNGQGWAVVKLTLWIGDDGDCIVYHGVRAIASSGIHTSLTGVVQPAGQTVRLALASLGITLNRWGWP
jgi:hypothetical protein